MTPAEFASLAALASGNAANLRAASQTANVFRKLGLATAFAAAAETVDEGMARERDRYESEMAEALEAPGATVEVTAFPKARLPYKDE